MVACHLLYLHHWRNSPLHQGDMTMKNVKGWIQHALTSTSGFAVSGNLLVALDHTGKPQGVYVRTPLERPESCEKLQRWIASIDTMALPRIDNW